MLLGLSRSLRLSDRQLVTRSESHLSILQRKNTTQYKYLCRRNKQPAGLESLIEANEVDTMYNHQPLDTTKQSIHLVPVPKDLLAQRLLRCHIQ